MNVLSARGEPPDALTSKGVQTGTMGLFQHRPEDEQQEWAGLPSEPVDRSTVADALEAAVDVDPSAISSATTMSVVFPVAPPAPEAADVVTGEPED